MFMALYIGLAGFNLYTLMFPLARIDLQSFPERDLVRSLWSPKADRMHMRVYISSRPSFSFKLVQSEFEPTSGETEVLWDQEIDAGSVSKTFMLTTRGQDEKESDKSYEFAETWLDEAEKASEDGGLLQTLTSAGQGIESTSILLTFYQSVSTRLSSLFSYFSSSDVSGENVESLTKNSIAERSIVRLSARSPIWAQLQRNQTIHLHVVVIQKTGPIVWPPSTAEEATNSLKLANKANSLLHGKVALLRHGPPDHVKKPGRVLYHDILFVFRKYLVGSSEEPPWDLSFSKPEEFAIYNHAQKLKANDEGYPFWKPEVAVKYVNDDQLYPSSYAGASGMPIVNVPRSQSHPTGYAFTPELHVDEIGLTSDKYIPVNGTVTSLPLKITFDRSDMDMGSAGSTATSGGLSPARWRLLTHFSKAIESQAQLGFEQSDIDDVRRLVADTNVTLLAITMLASALHLLFEFLTFKSEVNFWNNNKDLTGLSVRALFLDMIGQTVILLFLIEKDSSLLMILPSACGCLIALWKCQRAAGLRFVKISSSKATTAVRWWNRIPRLFGYELRAVRLEQQRAESNAETDDAETKRRQKLSALTIETDQLATRTLGTLLLPAVLAYTVYSLIKEEHAGWYSWLITSASSAVYALGFVLMTPQLFLNWKLKSVAHLPWRVLVYKSLNTFIDDLFSFIIRMPTMARISCFRDDVVFFIYLYQRWLYPVDESRPVEGGDDGRELQESIANTKGKKTKKE